MCIVSAKIQSEFVEGNQKSDHALDLVNNVYWISGLLGRSCDASANGQRGGVTQFTNAWRVK
jgi:hypothetical protein